MCERYLGNAQAALSTIAELIQAYPRHARAYQERGHLTRYLGPESAAIRAYEKALELNPTLIASWKNLAELFSKQGLSEQYQLVLKELERLNSLPPEIRSVASFLYEGKLFKAERLCREYLKRHPKHVEAMRLLALIGAKLHVLDDAEFLLESALEFDPNNFQVRTDYIGILQRRQKFSQALDQAKLIQESDPDQNSFQLIYANALAAAGKYDEALKLYLEELPKQPKNATLQMAMGHAYKTIGNQKKAVSSYENATKIRQDFGDAYWSLANLKTYKFSNKQIQALEKTVADEETNLEDQYHACFALGKAFEDKGEYEKSFSYYEKGNSLKKKESRYDSSKMTEELNLQMQVCTESFFEERSGFGSDTPDPIFIVGLPRAGSTLLEQILASHSQVEGTLELPNILSLVRKLQGRRRVTDRPRYPDILNTIGKDDYAKFGDQYITDTAFHRIQKTSFFTDKMPNNFRHIGLIHLVLPNAKIIDARRNPMDCCFSCYKQLFAEGQEFTYNLEDLSQYYKDYVTLMDHWDRVLPGRVLRVHHEEVIEDLETQVKRLLDYCELPFEQGCLEFYKTDRAVRTASSEQVRQPIYQSSEQWKSFEPYLTQLKSIPGS